MGGLGRGRACRGRGSEWRGGAWGRQGRGSECRGLIGTRRGGAPCGRCGEDGAWQGRGSEWLGRARDPRYSPGWGPGLWQEAGSSRGPSSGDMAGIKGISVVPGSLVLRWGSPPSPRAKLGAALSARGRRAAFPRTRHASRPSSGNALSRSLRPLGCGWRGVWGAFFFSFCKATGLHTRLALRDPPGGPLSRNDGCLGDLGQPPEHHLGSSSIPRGVLPPPHFLPSF